MASRMRNDDANKIIAKLHDGKKSSSGSQRQVSRCSRSRRFSK